MIRSTANRRLRHGMLFLEILAALVVLTAFSLVAYELCGDCLRMAARIDEKQNTLAGHDAAIRQLRQDVWGASEIKISKGALQLTTPHETITWQTTGDDLHRVAGDYVDHRWPGCGDVTFEPSNDVVIVRANTGPSHQSEEFRLASEDRLLAEDR